MDSCYYLLLIQKMYYSSDCLSYSCNMTHVVLNLKHCYDAPFTTCNKDEQYKEVKANFINTANAFKHCMLDKQPKYIVKSKE